MVGWVEDSKIQQKQRLNVHPVAPKGWSCWVSFFNPTYEASDRTEGVYLSNWGHDGCPEIQMNIGYE